MKAKTTINAQNQSSYHMQIERNGTCIYTSDEMHSHFLSVLKFKAKDGCWERNFDQWLLTLENSNYYAHNMFMAFWRFFKLDCESEQDVITNRLKSLYTSIVNWYFNKPDMIFIRRDDIFARLVEPSRGLYVYESNYRSESLPNEGIWTYLSEGEFKLLLALSKLAIRTIGTLNSDKCEEAPTIELGWAQKDFNNLVHGLKKFIEFTFNVDNYYLDVYDTIKQMKKLFMPIDQTMHVLKEVVN